MWIEFPSLLPISTFLWFLSLSEHSTQYSAEIIFCWMRSGHESRADLLRPLRGLLPGLLPTWQFKSLITLTRNPFTAEWSRPTDEPRLLARELCWRQFWAPPDGTPSPGFRGAQGFRGWSRHPPPPAPTLFYLPLPPEGHFTVTRAISCHLLLP